MKKTFLLFFITWVTSGFILSQNNYNKRFTENSFFLLNSFHKGIAYFNNGGKSEAKYNYNVVYDKVCFIKNDQIYEISNHSELDSIKINNLTLYCFDEKNYELIVPGEIKILLYRKANFSSPAPEGAYGTSSNTASVSRKTSLYTGKGLYGGENVNIQNKSDSEIPIVKKYYFQVGDELILATKNQVNKYYKNNKTEIKEFIKENKIDFQDINGLKSLISFLKNLN